jgi:hypothetical protein
MQDLTTLRLHQRAHRCRPQRLRRSARSNETLHLPRRFRIPPQLRIQESGIRSQDGKPAETSRHPFGIPLPKLYTFRILQLLNSCNS